MKSTLKYYIKLLTSKNIKKILNNYSDYNIKEVNKNSIILIKETNFKYEIVKIQGARQLIHVTCEKRPKGIIVTELQEAFDTTAYSRGENILVELTETRFVFTNSKLVQLIPNLNDLSLDEVVEILRFTTVNGEAVMKTHFTTYMSYMVKTGSGNWEKSAIIPTKTYLNGEDVSMLYDDVNGNDKLYRIHDLYNGIMNLRNVNDIQNISLGLLTTDAFGLKTLKNITFDENKLVGNPLEVMSQEQIDYIKKYFIDKIGYNGDIRYDRESLLECITYREPNCELTKKKQ